MGINFPANPSAGDIYEEFGLTYRFDGTIWRQGTSGSTDIYVKRAGDSMFGPLALMPAYPTADTHATHKKYVDERIAAESLYQGTWQVAANIPDLNVPPNAPLNGYSWICQTVNPSIPEVAPASIPGIGGLTCAATDTVNWNETLGAYELIKGAVGIARMIISDTPPATGFHGQLLWDSDSGKQYVYYSDGTSDQWVQISGGGGSSKGTIVDDAPADGQIYGRKDLAWAIASAGVFVGDAPPAAPVQGELWWNSSNGTMYLWYNDGTSSQWVDVSGGGDYLSLSGGTLTGDLSISPAAGADATLNLDSDSSQASELQFKALDAIKFALYTDSQTTGPDTGHKLWLDSYVDAGTKTNVFGVDRVTQVVDFTQNPTVNGVPIGGGVVFVGDTAPATPTPGQLWWETATGKLAIWYEDVDSSQWVQLNGGGSSGGVTGAFLPLDGSLPMTNNLKIAKAGWKGVQLCQADATTIDWVINGDEQTFRISAVAGGGADMFGLAADGSGAFFFCPLFVENVPVVTEAPADGSQYTRQDNQWVANTVTVQATGGHGDVKMGFQGTDHAGWVRLDGRAITALTPTQQDVAINTLGFTTNIPDATDVVAMQPGVARAMGSVAGSWNIAQANLPAVNLTAASAGGHNHLFDVREGAADKNFWGFVNDGRDATDWAADVMIARSHAAGGTVESAPKPIFRDAGAHTHTVALGGSGTPITPKNMAVNMFVFLGD
jgi:hypothetical protein